VLYFANLLAGWDASWSPAPIDEQEATLRTADSERYADLVAEAEEDIAELRAALAV
jgi:hypothetical protein